MLCYLGSVDKSDAIFLIGVVGKVTLSILLGVSFLFCKKNNFAIYTVYNVYDS
jgi:hypothetical protein